MDPQKPKRIKKITVLAYGEGEDEKIFIRHLVSNYCRYDKVTVASNSAGGGDPKHILHGAIRYRGAEKRDFQFILLDTDKEWPKEVVEQSKIEEIELIGSTPCLEAFFLEILDLSEKVAGKGPGKCKEVFEAQCISNNFNESECQRLFPKTVLSSARIRIPKLDKIIKIIEGNG